MISPLNLDEAFTIGIRSAYLFIKRCLPGVCDAFRGALFHLALDLDRHRPIQLPSCNPHRGGNPGV